MTLGERIALITIALVALLAAVTSMCRRQSTPPPPPATADTAKVSIRVDSSKIYSADSLPSKRKKHPSDSIKARKNRPIKSSKPKAPERSRMLTPEQEATQFK